MLKKDEENLVHAFRLVIDKAITKHRRENLNHPTPEEYIHCFEEALLVGEVGIKEERKPGRPKKVKVTVVEPTLKVK